MNLTFHIIKKDLRRMAWALAVWAGCGLYLVLVAKAGVRDLSWWDNLRILAIGTYSIMTLMLIAAIVQEDGLTESDVFWRTRPTSAARLLTAKLGLLVPLFVLVPVGITLVSKWAASAGFHLTGRELGYLVLVSSSVMLSCAAVASCSKDLVRYVTLGALSVITCAVLTAWLSRFAPLPAPGLRGVVGTSRAVAVLVLCLLMSAAMIANQYLGRRGRVSLTYGLLAGAVVGSALINTFWTWNFLSR